MQVIQNRAWRKTVNVARQKMEMQVLRPCCDMLVGIWMSLTRHGVCMFSISGYILPSHEWNTSYRDEVLVLVAGSTNIDALDIESGRSRIWSRNGDGM